jgi:hypothetical protein
MVSVPPTISLDVADATGICEQGVGIIQVRGECGAWRCSGVHRHSQCEERVGNVSPKGLF